MANLKAKFVTYIHYCCCYFGVRCEDLWSIKNNFI